MAEDAQRHSELASFGEELRREREIRGISLKEIADATKISRRFLDAIERNDHGILPAPVFTRGFVREYARYLGLSADEMVNRYNFAAAGDDRIEQSDHLTRLTTPQVVIMPPKLRPSRSIPPAYARIDRNLIIIALIVAALFGISYWALKHRPRRESEPPRADAAVPRRVDGGLKPAAPLAPPSATLTAAAAAPAAGTLKLVVDVTANSWVVLDADGRNVVSDTLRRGDHRVFEAKERFRFRTVGNAAGVSLTLNDEKLAPLGGEGEVIHDRVLDRASLPQPAPPPRDRT
jgi:transcriptional regulator with XRE-family HTH domain